MPYIARRLRLAELSTDTGVGCEGERERGETALYNIWIEIVFCFSVWLTLKSFRLEPQLKAQFKYTLFVSETACDCV